MTRGEGDDGNELGMVRPLCDITVEPFCGVIL